MNNAIRRRVSGPATLLSLFFAGAAAAQPAGERAALRLPAVGTFEKGGTFAGTAMILRFEQRDERIMAIGFVSGLLSRPDRQLGTGVAGEIAWPVAISSGELTMVSLPAASLRARARLTSISWPGDAQAVPAQPVGCSTLHVELAPVEVDLLGIPVTLAHVAVDMSGALGTPLGDQVCAVADLMGKARMSMVLTGQRDVSRLVNVLNDLLGLLSRMVGKPDERASPVATGL